VLDLLLWGSTAVKIWRLLSITTNLFHDNYFLFLFLFTVGSNNQKYKLTLVILKEIFLNKSVNSISVLSRTQGDPLPLLLLP
jgi:hypothetical protein